MGGWSKPLQLTKNRRVDTRAQIAVSNDDLYHVVYHDRTDEGDIIRHRMSPKWNQVEPCPKLGARQRTQLGTDIIVRPDESAVVVYDHAMPDFRSRGYVTTFDPMGATGSAPVPLTPDDGGEIGSGHVADATGQDLAYIFIGKLLWVNSIDFKPNGGGSEMVNGQRFKPFQTAARSSRHTNVERRSRWKCCCRV